MKGNLTWDLSLLRHGLNRVTGWDIRLEKLVAMEIRSSLRQTHFFVSDKAPHNRRCLVHAI